MLNSGKCDKSVQDASGDFALHLAAKVGNKKCVEILLPNPENKLFQAEDGVGLTVVDCAMLRTTQIFHANRQNNTPQYGYRMKNNNNNNTAAQHQTEIYNYIVKNLKGGKRVLVKGSLIRSGTEVLVNQANLDVEQKKGPQRGRVSVDDVSMDNADIGKPWLSATCLPGVVAADDDEDND